MNNTLFRYSRKFLIKLKKVNGLMRNIQSQEIINKILWNTRFECFYVYSCIIYDITNAFGS